MKKVIVGLVAVGAVIALGPVVRRKAHKMRQHFEQMAAKCKQMMAAQPEGHGEAAGMREHCKEMMATHNGHSEAAETMKRSEQEAPQFAGGGEAVGTA